MPLDFNRKMKKGKKTKKRCDFGCWQRLVWAMARHQMSRGREREASPVALAGHQGHQGHLGHRVTLSNGHLFEGGHLLAVKRAACQDTPLPSLKQILHVKKILRNADGVPLNGERVVIPTSLRQAILKSLHSEH